MFSRWRSGKNIKTIRVNEHETKLDNDSVNLYTFGGETRISKEAVVGYSDLTPTASVSKGTPNQTFYTTALIPICSGLGILRTPVCGKTNSCASHSSLPLLK